ncbi:MAG TPA: HAD family phosphatase [Chitinophagaceae bacterium]|nr:HAD family phosphatase [Chitinophagaceae bacterium]
MKKLTKVDQLKGFLFDLNGTMNNDMPYHVSAWHRIMSELGAHITLERMKQECYGKNHDVIERIFPGRFSYEEKTRMGFEKESQYQKDFRPHLKLIDGLDRFLKDAHEGGIKLGIGSAAIKVNIDFVLDGLHIRKYFDAIVGADDVIHSKPDPETWIKCADKLTLPPSECIVFEDSPKGAESALNAGIKCVIITNLHEQDEVANYENVIAFIDDYTSIRVSQLNNQF